VTPFQQLVFLAEALHPGAFEEALAAANKAVDDGAALPERPTAADLAWHSRLASATPFCHRATCRAGRPTDGTGPAPFGGRFGHVGHA